uniref:Uncharacterized protein n=1 Tax=Picea glauca TaxID=3330 RepID=A0A101M2U9_PICGL|nr:hypothetical protein ABT39_MTgene3099 [Picea glauca]QHR87200.1 hypothetical protein Q903MT_gene1209 [Picea sitchensis]
MNSSVLPLMVLFIFSCPACRVFFVYLVEHKAFTIEGGKHTQKLTYGDINTSHYHLLNASAGV